MRTYEVEVTRVTTYRVRAEDENGAIDGALEDNGIPVDEVTTGAACIGTVLDTLVGMARDSTTYRGHPMGETEYRGDGTARIDCTTCPGWVIVDEHPPANGIDIGGSAVALNCPITEETR